MTSPLVTIGILSFKDKKYLEKGLPSLLEQNYPNFEILICDNNEDPQEEIRKWINDEFPNIKVLNAGGNIGFGRGHNYLISQSHPDSQYYLCFNSDMYAAPDFISRLVQTIEKDKKIGAVTGKLLKWSDFPSTPSRSSSATSSGAQEKIDTTGLLAHASHYFAERGHGELDQGQYDTTGEIWGTSGAAVMFRMEALQDVKQSKNEFFDKNFFMYKEDIDLSYRLRWAGWKIFYTPQAISWHDRTAQDPGGIIENIKKRKDRAPYIKENSFLNHLQLLYKNWSPDYSLKTKFKTSIFLLKYFLYLAIFDRKVLAKYQTFRQLKPSIIATKSSMPRRITAKEMEKWFL